MSSLFPMALLPPKWISPSWCAANSEQRSPCILLTPLLGSWGTRSSTTCGSNTPGCCFWHLLGDADPPSANEPRNAMEPGVLPCRSERCPAFCPEEHAGNGHSRPCQLLPLRRDSRPSKVCTWGYNRDPHCSLPSLSSLSPSVAL